MSDSQRSSDADARVGCDDPPIGSFASDVPHLNAQPTNFIGSQQTVAPLGNFPPEMGKTRKKEGGKREKEREKEREREEKKEIEKKRERL